MSPLGVSCVCVDHESGAIVRICAHYDSVILLYCCYIVILLVLNISTVHRANNTMDNTQPTIHPRRIQARMRVAHPIPGVQAHAAPRRDCASRAEKARLAALADRPPLRRSRSTWAPGVQAHADQGTPGSLDIFPEPVRSGSEQRYFGTRSIWCKPGTVLRRYRPMLSTDSCMRASRSLRSPRGARHTRAPVGSQQTTRTTPQDVAPTLLPHRFGFTRLALVPPFS